MHLDRKRSPETRRALPLARLAIVLAAVALAATACGGDDESATTTAPPGTTAAPSGPETRAVEIGDLFFEPNTVTVSVGDTVTWQHQGNLPHTTTAGTPGSQTGAWDSGTMSSGDSFSMTFDSAGTFQYFCTIHPDQMQATITVTEG